MNISSRLMFERFRDLPNTRRQRVMKMIKSLGEVDPFEAIELLHAIMEIVVPESIYDRPNFPESLEESPPCSP